MIKRPKNEKFIWVKPEHHYTTEEMYTGFYKCKNCKETDITIYYNYCPTCGIKLKFHKDTNYV